MTAKSQGQRLINQSHLIEIHRIKVCRDGGIELLGVQQGIDIQPAIHQGIVTEHINQGMSVTDSGLCCHVVQVPMTIAQMLDLCIGCQQGTWRQEVGTLSCYLHIGCHRIDGVARHEVMDIQLIDMQGGIVAHQVGVQLSLQLYPTLTFVGCHIESIVGTIGLHTPLGTDAVGNAVVALHLSRQHLHQKTKIIPLCLEPHVSTQLLGIIQVVGIARHSGVDSRGQRHFQVAELHVLHIATECSLHL